VVKGLILLLDYYGNKNNDQGDLRISLTQEQYASFLCLTREYLNKIFRELKRKKIIEISKNGYLHIPSIPRLLAESA